MDEVEQTRVVDRHLVPEAGSAKRFGLMGRHKNGVRWVSCLLWTLAVLDLGLALVAFFGPGLWFRVVHGAPYVDPQGLLPRTGASWAMFAVLEAAAALRWKREPAWLFAIAVVRASDMATDWTYLAFSTQLSPLGVGLLAGASPANFLLAVLLWSRWRGLSSRPV